MKQHLNTLFITTQGAYLHRDGECIAVNVEQKTRTRVPIHTLGGVVCFGHVACSPAVLGFCGEHDVTISFLSTQGRFRARVVGPVSGNVLLRRAQYRRAEPEPALQIARPIVTAKIANARQVLLRAGRERPDGDDAASVRDAAKRLQHLAEDARNAPNLGTLRGLEGDASRAYFRVFGLLIVSQRDDFPFQGRNRRPPTDAVNALLSFLYALLAHDTTAALESVGLDPQVGFLHRDRPGRPGLALDLMEEFRAFLADRLALTLINRLQIKARGFRHTESGAVRMDDATRKTLLIAYQQRKAEQIRHPFLGERVTIGLLPHLQARLLARHLRGDLDAYPPFFWR